MALSLKEAGTVKILVYKDTGELASTLESQFAAGQQYIPMTLSGFAPGVYFYLVRINYDSGGVDDHKPRKFVVIR